MNETKQQANSKEPIQPMATYSRKELVRVSGFSQMTIIRAEESGRLRVRREGRRVFYFGKDILQWLGLEVAA